MEKLPFQGRTAVNLLPLNLMVSPHRILIVTHNLGCWTQGVSFWLGRPLIKIEIRNPKSETIPKSEFSNDRNGSLAAPPFGILVIQDSNLLFVLRYSNFRVHEPFDLPYPRCPAKDMGHAQLAKGGEKVICVICEICG